MVNSSGITITSGMGIELCKFTSIAGPALSDLDQCDCNNNGVCLGGGTTPNVTAWFTAGVSSSNECSSSYAGDGGGGYTFKWCQDLPVAYDIKAGPRDLGTFDNPVIDLKGGIKNFTATKGTCGLAFAQPTADYAAPDRKSYAYEGVYAKTYADLNLPILVTGYSPTKDSGLMSLGNDVDAMDPTVPTANMAACVQAMDPCGRKPNGPASQINYGIWLLSEQAAGGVTAHIAKKGNSPIMFYHGNLCMPGAYAGCNAAVGQYKCYDRGSVAGYENFGKPCHSGWNETLFIPSSQDACYASKHDPDWGSLGNPAKEALAGERCAGASYTCHDEAGRYGDQMNCSGLGYLDYCNLGGQCNNQAPVLGTCDGGTDPTTTLPYTDAGKACQGGGDCLSGSCTGAVQGACAHDSGVGCWSDSECDVSGLNVKCQIVSMGVCNAPTTRVCDPPTAMATPDAYYPPYAYGSCGAPAPQQEAAYCSSSGTWVNWYCGYGDQTNLPAEAQAAGATIVTISPGPTGCYHVTVPGDTCDPSSQTSREALGGSGAPY